ncbi:YdeI/OmpD-associated family protein [Emticicia sp. BO119]|uniref:YdeI/OmpD-associated family protein n=1 Tax=Emticicia sp. BO119 TaxID=2757768 RepID=UPI0015F0A4B2|nr:YdeI/OmpD-associated family protein [Emticicia sp. BO119]MBA4849347.1 YdeI/OmpD-associated family protein [Emticicia sp. BO119]
MVELPYEFGEALNKSAKVLKLIERFPTEIKRFTIPIEKAKTQETRSKRIEKLLLTLNRERRYNRIFKLRVKLSLKLSQRLICISQ